jgi:cell division protein FtsQ
MGTDLMQLRSRVMADGQVRSATITRLFPDTLSVRISERSPVARLRVPSADAEAATLLVSRDGVTFPGTGFDPAMVASLPWLDGVKPAKKGAAMAPIEGMAAVGDLLASAKLEAEGLYRTWQVVSLARLATDSVIEVQTKDGMKVTFGTTDDYLRQIARLDLLIGASTDATRPLRAVDLSLGSQVPVAYGTAAPTLGERPPAEVPSAAPAGPLIMLPSFSSNQSATHRGL